MQVESGLRVILIKGLRCAAHAAMPHGACKRRNRMASQTALSHANSLSPQLLIEHPSLARHGSRHWLSSQKWKAPSQVGPSSHPAVPFHHQVADCEADEMPRASDLSSVDKPIGARSPSPLAATTWMRIICAITELTSRWRFCRKSEYSRHTSGLGGKYFNFQHSNQFNRNFIT